jgi:hypothetical protein
LSLSTIAPLKAALRRAEEACQFRFLFSATDNWPLTTLWIIGSIRGF